MHLPEMAQRLKRVARLSMLNDEALTDLALVISTERHPPGTVICQQGALEDKFYAIELGQIIVQITVDDRQVEVARLSEGDVFGERALIGGRPRTATVVAETTVDLLALDRQEYQSLAQKHPSLARILIGPEVIPLLQEVPLFSHLSEEDLSALSEYVGIIFLPPGRRVCEQGDLGMTMYVVYQGELVAYQLDERGRNRPVKAIRKGQAFGETSLLVGEPRDATVVTKAYAELCYINKASFDRFLQEYPHVQDRLQARPEVERKRKAAPFPGQQRGEIVAVMDSKHWAAFVRAILQPALLLGLVGVVLIAVDLLRLSQTVGLEWLPVALTVLWILAGATVFAWHWMDWRNDFYIVTTQRVIRVENVLWRATTRDEVPVHQVQNVNIERGLWGGVLDFGHVFVTTAGAAEGTLDLEYVNDPDEFQRIIFEQINRAKYSAVASERAELRRAIRQAIGLSVLEEEIQEEPPPPARSLPPAWVTLLTQNWLARRLHQTMTSSGLATFLRHPHLPRQEIHEENQVTWRKHWGVLLSKTHRPLLLSGAFLLLVLGVVGWQFGWLPFLPDISAPWLNSVLLILILSAIPALGWLAWEVEDWRNDQYIVTDTDIIDIERTPLLLRESRRQASLDNIQNTTSSTEGFWAGLLKLGDVTIETAGEGTFTFEQVYNPNKVQAEIDRRREAHQVRLRQQEGERRRADMAKWFDAYHDVSREIETHTHRGADRLRPVDWTEDTEGEGGNRREV